MQREGGDTALPFVPEHFPVAHLHWTLPPVAGGVETHLAEFARVLAARGHPVTLFTGRGGLEDVPGVDIVRTEFLDLDRYSPSPSESVLRERAERFAVTLRAELGQRGIKVVHGHNLHHFTPVPAMVLTRLQNEMGLRVHHTYHSIWDDSPDIADLCRGWPGQHALSEYVSKECANKLKLPTIHTRPGVAHDRYDDVPPPPTGPGDQVVLLPARLFPEKGAKIAVRMLHSLRAEGFAVRLILTTPAQTVDWERTSVAFRGELDALVTALGLDRHVEFRAATFDEMPRLYAESNIVIYPSVYPEPLGLAPLEAAAAGRPVVVAGIGGLPETVDPDVTGYIIPPHDPDTLTDRVRTLLGDRQLAHQMGQSGKLFVRRFFALESYVSRMIEYYRASLVNG